MNNIKVSVVVISYNVRKYIEECLESIVNQTLKEIEIICVDAFSDDGTREVIEEYAKRDSRIHILNDTERSCGFSYNIGIQAAKGEYIGFVESDDYIRLDMFEKLYGLAREHSLDYVKGNHIHFVNVGSENRYYEEEHIFYWKPEIYNQIINPFLYPEIIGPDHCMWNGIYHSSFLKDKNIKLNETKGPSYQDHGFQWQTICSATRVMYLNEAFYYYRKDNEKASMKNTKGLIKDYDEYMFIKNYIQSRQDMTREHWWSYYSKMIWSVHTWCGALLAAFDVFPSDVYTSLDKYIDEFREAVSKDRVSPVKLYFELYSEMMLLCSSKDDYLKYLKNKTLSKTRYEERIIEKAKDSRETIIIGGGICGKRLCTLLLRNGVNNIVAVGDNNDRLQGEKLWRIPIMSVEDICHNHSDAMYFIANNNYYMDLLRQLKSYGINEKNIDFYRVEGMEF